MNCINCSSNVIDFDERLEEFVCGDCRTVLVSRIHEDVFAVTYKPNVTHVRHMGERTLETEVNMIASYYEFDYEVEDDIKALIREVLERGLPCSERMVAKAILHYVFKCHMIPNNIRKKITGERDKRTFKKAYKAIKHYADTPWWRTGNAEGHVARVIDNLFIADRAVPMEYIEEEIDNLKRVVGYMDDVLMAAGIGRTMTNYAMMVHVFCILTRTNISIVEIADLFFVSTDAIKSKWKKTQHLFNVTSRSILNLTLEEFIEGIRYE